MAKNYQTFAHTVARKEGFQCDWCTHSLKDAKYEGEYTFVYDKAGNDKMVSVFLTCRCGCINDVSMDITQEDGFMDAVNRAPFVPHRAKKITTAPAMAEENANS